MNFKVGDKVKRIKNHLVCKSDDFLTNRFRALKAGDIFIIKEIDRTGNVKDENDLWHSVSNIASLDLRDIIKEIVKKNERRIKSQT